MGAVCRSNLNDIVSGGSQGIWYQNALLKGLRRLIALCQTILTGGLAGGDPQIHKINLLMKTSRFNNGFHMIPVLVVIAACGQQGVAGDGEVFQACHGL